MYGILYGTLNTVLKCCLNKMMQKLELIEYMGERGHSGFVSSRALDEKPNQTIISITKRSFVSDWLWPSLTMTATGVVDLQGAGGK